MCDSGHYGSDDLRIVVSPSEDGGYSARIERPATGMILHETEAYESKRKAKADAIKWIQEDLEDFDPETFDNDA